jgi:CRP-like cAMP-binding protein
MPASRFVDLTERILYLRSIPVAAELPPPVLKIIASYLRERDFPKGSVLMRQGEPVAALELLTEGSLALVRNGKPFGKLAPPQSLGFLAILARSDGTYDASAEEDTRSLSLDADALIELLEDHVELFHATLRYFADRLLYEIMELPADMLEGRLRGETAAPDRKLDIVERIVELRMLRAFRRTNLNALVALAEHLEERRVGPGETLWQKGEPADHALIVLAGTATCEDRDLDKRWQAGPRSVLGGIEGMVSKPRWYTLSAATLLVSYRLSSTAFVDLLEDDFAMGLDFISMLAGELVDLLERKALMGKSTVGVKRDVSKLGAVPVGA